MNKSVVKISFLILLAGVYAYVAATAFKENLKVLLSGTVLVFVAYIAFHGLPVFLPFIKGWYRRLIVQPVACLIFFGFDKKWDLFETGIYNSKEEYWFYFTVYTFLNLLCSVVYFDGLLRLIRYRDILALPLGMDSKKNVIFFKNAIVVLSDKFRNEQIVIQQIPEIQHHKINRQRIFPSFRHYFLLSSYKSFLNNMKFDFKMRLVIVLSLITYVIEYTKVNSLLIENRINHSYKIKPK